MLLMTLLPAFLYYTSKKLKHKEICYFLVRITFVMLSFPSAISLFYVSQVKLAFIFKDNNVANNSREPRGSSTPVCW